LLLTPPSQTRPVVCLVPLSERSSVDLDNGRLGEGIRADELVVGRVKGNSKDTDFARDAFRAPGEIAGVDS